MNVRVVTVALASVLLLVACGGSEGNVFTLETGDCFDDPELVDGRVRDVPDVECEEPHDNEVYALVELQEGTFPGADSIAARADEACAAEFATFVGIEYADSELFASYFSPSEDSWDAGDRTVVCYLFAQGETLEGSMQDSGR